MRPGLNYKLERAPRSGQARFRLADAGAVPGHGGPAAHPDPLLHGAQPRAARKSTIVAIAAIGFFYILTLFMGSGAMINGVLEPGETTTCRLRCWQRPSASLLFAIISAIAFATVLGTVSGLIVAASGAVAHDLMDRFLSIKMTEQAEGSGRQDGGRCRAASSPSCWASSSRG